MFEKSVINFCLNSFASCLQKFWVYMA